MCSGARINQRAARKRRAGDRRLITFSPARGPHRVASSGHGKRGPRPVWRRWPTRWRAFPLVGSKPRKFPRADVFRSAMGCRSCLC